MSGEAVSGAAGPGAREWRALGASVRGTQHVRRGLPNQDALAWRPATGGGVDVSLAVADGHGSARHFRSGAGAALAAGIAADFLLAQAGALSLDWSGVSRLSAQNWPHALTRRWAEAVSLHLGTHPYDDEERAKARADGDDVASAYGTTLLGVLATPHFLVHLQIGDGDMLAVSEEGEVSRPLPADPRCLGVSTASLCASDARHQFRARFQALTGAGPALLLAATDGYGVSFAQEEAFAQAGADFLRLLRAEGPEAVQSRLPDWLRETSEAGSGDDVTVALLYRPSAL